MLKRIVIENYRSCLRTALDLHPKLSVLIGPNGSGKTNILQAMMFLSKMASDERLGVSRRDPITVNSRIKATFKGRQQIRLNASIEAYTDASNNDAVLASRQRWLIEEPKKKPVAFDFPLAFFASSGGPFHSARRLHQLYLFRERVALNLPDRMDKLTPALSKLARFCLGIRYYGASQFTNPGSCPASFQIEQEGQLSRLFRSRGHVRVLYDMYTAAKLKSNERYRQFIDIVGPKGLRLIDDLTFRTVQTSSVDYSVRVGGRVEVRRRHKVLVIPQFRIGRQKLSPNQLSEGTFKTLALLFHVMTEDGTALLIEEPEVCVHHGLLSSILELIKSSSKRKQIVISTHSDYVLDQVKPENVYRVAFDKVAGTLVHHIPETMTAKELAGLRAYLGQEGNLGEYWREGGLGDRS